MATASDQLPDNVDELKTALIETRAKLSGAEAMIEHLQLVIAKMKREMFGPRSERSQRILDQLELQLEELAAAAGEDATKVETASVHVKGFTRRKATRRNFPEHLPRRRLGDCLAGPAAELLAHMLGDEPLPGDDIEGFGDILADFRELAAAAARA